MIKYAFSETATTTRFIDKNHELGLKRLNNADFISLELEGIRMLAGLNSFAMTPKQWIEKIKAIGIVSHAGRYGGTYAHKDIAFSESATSMISGH